MLCFFAKHDTAYCYANIILSNIVIKGGFDWSSSGIVTRFDHMTFSSVFKI